MSRHCLICSNINPCREHSEVAQEAELYRNTREFYGRIYHRETEVAGSSAPAPDAGQAESMTPTPSTLPEGREG